MLKTNFLLIFFSHFTMIKLFLFFSDFFASFVLQNHMFNAGKSLFLLFISFFLLSCFFSCFFLSSCFVKGIWWQGTKHAIKRNEWRQWWEWSRSSEKGGPLLVFSAWLKVWVDGPESTKENASADFSARFGSNSVFSCDSVTCVRHRQPAQHPRVNAEHHLLMFSLSLSIFTLFMFTLLPQHVAKSYWKEWATWGGEAEPWGFFWSVSKIRW